MCAKISKRNADLFFSSLQTGQLKAAIYLAALSCICPAYCDINGNNAMQKFLKTMFSITVFAGIVLIAAGAASLIRTIVSMASGGGQA